MDVYALVGLIVVIAVICALLEIPDRFQKLLYFVCAILLVLVVCSLFGITFGGHLQVR